MKVVIKQHILWIWNIVWFLYLAGAMVTPLLLRDGHYGSFLILRFFYGINCHQISERCYHIFGSALPICTRCTGIYIGFLLSGLSAVFFRRYWFLLADKKKRIIVILLCGGPTVIDTFMKIVNLAPTYGSYRMFIGIFFGVALFAAITPIFFEIMNRIKLDLLKIEKDFNDNIRAEKINEIQRRREEEKAQYKLENNNDLAA